MKKIIFRIVAITVLAVMIMICAAACGGKNDTTSADSSGEVSSTPGTTADIADTTVPDTEAPVLSVDEIPQSVLSESLTVSGKVSDNVSLASVKVGGIDASISGDSFSATVKLVPGDNEIEIVAADDSGNLSEIKKVKVCYIAYLNNLMPKDDLLTMYNAPAFADAHQDGFVFLYNGEIYLIDGGMSDKSAASTYNYLLGLRKSVLSETTIKGVEDMKLQLNLIISHFHYDHVGALIDQIIPDAKFEIASIYYTKASEYHLGSDADNRAGVLNAANMADAKKVELDFGKTETIEVGDLKIKLYAPSEDWGANRAEKVRAIYYPSKDASYQCSDAVENSNSMWAKISFGGKSMLFTGDVTKKMHDSYVAVGSYFGVGGEPFDVMISYYGADEFDIDIIKFPHHGNLRGAAMHGVCEAMTPDVIIFTSLFNEYRPVMHTLAGSMYKKSYASSSLNGMTFTLNLAGKLDAVRADKVENIYGENGEYLGIRGELFEERSIGVTPSASLAGKGSRSDPYLIGSREDLAYFAENYYELCGEKGACFKLTADIVWSDYKSGLLPVSNWNPIGSPNIGMKPFVGTFDGDGHSISGIYCAGSSEGSMIFGGDNYYLLGNVSGFFGAINGTVKNLIIKDSSFYGNRMVGALVAYVAPGGNTSIINCANYALVQGFEGVGGIFGGYYQRSSYGPLHDDVDATGTVLIDKCVNFGAVNSISTDSNASTGGIAGSFREMKKATVTECANYGNVTSTGGCTGGIIGQAIYCELIMKNCVNSGTVLGLTLNGGIIGKIQYDATYPKTLEALVNYAHVGATKDGRVGYINGSDASAKNQDCFSGKSYYYLSSAILVPAAGSKVVTEGTSHASKYTSVSASELVALDSLNLSADIWTGNSNVTGTGYGLPTLKTITVVKLFD